MSDEPSGWDMEALADLCLASLHYTEHGHRYRPREAAERILASDWYAERIAQARCEGAAEAMSEAIEAAHVERRRVWDEDRNEPLMLDQHWGAVAGWLAWRTRAIERGDEPDWPDAMNAAALRGDS